MDTITHALLGATIAEAGFRERLGGGRAIVFGAVCAVLPDLDVVAGVAGEWASLAHHRGVTHSLLVLPILAVPLGWAGARFLGLNILHLHWIHLAFWALITHALLDLMTAYGTQLFAPFTDTRYAADAVAIIDLIFTVPLAVALFRRTRVAAFSALAFCALYLGLGVVVSASAEESARVELVTRKFRATSIRALPPILFPMMRRVVAKDAHGNIAVGFWSPFSKRTQFVNLDRDRDPLVKRALETEEGRIFDWFADGWISAIVVHHGDGRSDVDLSDQRYGLFVRPDRALFRASIAFDGNGEMIRAARIDDTDIDVGNELSAAWKLLRR
jgi:inner membrane protein